MRNTLLKSRFFVGFAALLFAACSVYATDIPITPTGPVWKFTAPSGPGALTWGSSGPGNFNNNFFFTPLSQNESVCVFVKNNNTTSAHTFTASISVNSDPANTTPSDGTWQVGASSGGLFAAISPGQPAGIGVSVSGSAQVSVNFSASSTQAGSPDTATVVIVQSPGNCFSGNQFVGSAPQTISAVKPIQAISEGLSQSFLLNIPATNPASGQTLFNINPNNSSKTIYLDRLVITCSAACSVSLAQTSNSGTGCISLAPAVNARLGSSVASLASIVAAACTTPPTQVSGLNIFSAISLGAGQTISVDLTGIILTSGTTQGLGIFASAFTGNFSAQIFWYEK